MHPLLVAAALRDRSCPAVALHLQRRLEHASIFAKRCEQSRRENRRCAGEALEDPEVWEFGRSVTLLHVHHRHDRARSGSSLYQQPQRQGAGLRDAPPHRPARICFTIANCRAEEGTKGHCCQPPNRQGWHDRSRTATPRGAFRDVYPTSALRSLARMLIPGCRLWCPNRI